MPGYGALAAIASILGGGAQGLSRGLGDIDRQNTDAERMRAEQLHYKAMDDSQQKQILIQQKQLDQAIATAKSADERANLVDARERLRGFTENLRGAGIASLDPQRTYDAFKGNSSGVLEALGGQINSISKSIGNEPRRYIPGTESQGGLVYEGHPFSPFSSLNQSQRNGTTQQNNFAKALASAQARIQTASRNSQDAYAKNPAIARLLASVDTELQRKGHQEADAGAKNAARAQAQAELNMLQTAFPEDSQGLSVEALLGASPLPQGGTTPTANPTSMPPRPPGSPNLNFNPTTSNPNDPLGIMGGAGSKPPQTPVNQPARPQTNPNDPLGIFTRRP